MQDSSFVYSLQLFLSSNHGAFALLGLMEDSKLWIVTLPASRGTHFTDASLDLGLSMTGVCFSPAILSLLHSLVSVQAYFPQYRHV